MNKPSPQILFCAIAKPDVDAVELYFAQGGDAHVSSDRGYPVLAEVALAVVQPEMSSEEEDEDEEDLAFFSSSTLDVAARASLTPRQEALKKIGDILIEQGANFDARCGRTNRSIKISDMIKSRAPMVYNEWKAISQRAHIAHAVEEVVDMDTKKSSPLKKI